MGVSKLQKKKRSVLNNDFFTPNLANIRWGWDAQHGHAF